MQARSFETCRGRAAPRPAPGTPGAQPRRPAALQGEREGGSGGRRKEGTERNPTFVLRVWWMSAASSPFHHCSSILFLPIRTKVWERDGAALPGGRANRTSRPEPRRCFRRPGPPRRSPRRLTGGFAAFRALQHGASPGREPPGREPPPPRPPGAAAAPLGAGGSAARGA